MISPQLVDGSAVTRLLGVWELQQPGKVFQAQWDAGQTRQRQAWWERDREVLRTLESQKPISNSP